MDVFERGVGRVDTAGDAKPKRRLWLDRTAHIAGGIAPNSTAFCRSGVIQSTTPLWFSTSSGSKISFRLTDSSVEKPPWHRLQLSGVSFPDVPELIALDLFRTHSATNVSFWWRISSPITANAPLSGNKVYKRRRAPTLVFIDRIKTIQRTTDRPFIVN